MSPGLRDDLSPSGIHVSASFSTGVGESLAPMSREGSLLRSLKPSRAIALIGESSVALEQVSNDLLNAQDKLLHLVKWAEAWSAADTQSTTGNTSPVTGTTKKERRKFVLRRKKKSNSSGSAVSDVAASASVSESEAGKAEVKIWFQIQLLSSRFVLQEMFIRVPLV